MVLEEATRVAESVGQRLSVPGMRVFDVRVDGLTPYQPHRYVEDTERDERVGPRPKDKSKEDVWRQREALLRFHENADGLPFMPGRNVRSAMIEGANATSMKHKTGRTASKLGPFLRRGILVEPVQLMFPKEVSDLLKAEQQKFTGAFPLNRDQVRVPPVTGALVIKYWPMLEEWGFDFTITVFDQSLEAESELLASLEAAGIFCGFGTGRPDYGKFRVSSWTEVSA